MKNDINIKRYLDITLFSTNIQLFSKRCQQFKLREFDDVKKV